MKIESMEVRDTHELDDRRKHITLIIHKDGAPDEVFELASLIGAAVTKKDYEEYMLTDNLTVGCFIDGILSDFIAQHSLETLMSSLAKLQQEQGLNCGFIFEKERNDEDSDI